MSDKSSFDPRSIATAPIVGLNATKTVLEYQASVLKLWAENCELMARNYEKGSKRSALPRASFERRLEVSIALKERISQSRELTFFP